jgi:lipopolysaccharide export system protein LptA
MQTKTKITVCSGVIAASLLLPGYAMAAPYRSDSETGVDALDYIENQHRAARENALDAEQQKLLQDTQNMKAHLRQPLDVKKSVPLTMEGDDLSYDERTGAVYAKGNVRITELDAKSFTTDEADGNLKTQDVDIEGKAHMLQITPQAPRVKLDGYKTQYNYGNKTGKMENVVGKVDHQYVTGERVEFYPKEVIIYNGTATKCAAKKPDYHTQAKKIEIWPNQKIIMHDVDFYIGSVRLYHKDRTETNIGPDAKNPVYPRVGYDNDDGLWIEQDFTQTVAPKVTAYADLRHTGKFGFRNVLGTRWDNGGNSSRVEYGYFEDGNNHWIKKQPTFVYNYGHRIGSWPISYGLNYELGNWYNNGIHSTHTYYGLSLSRDPISLYKNMTLYLSTGYSVTKESYNESRVQGFTYDATLVKDFNDRWSAFTGYHYSKNNSQNSLFNFNVDDYSRKFEAGFSYRFSDKDRFVIGQNYDVESKRLKDVDYYWYHDVHCAELIVRYRAKRSTWHIGFQFTPW